METSNANFKVEELTVRLSNSNDENRTHEISGTFIRERDGRERIEAGNVCTENAQQASFSAHDGNVSITFYVSSEKQPDVLAAVSSFIEGARHKIEMIIANAATL